MIKKQVGDITKVNMQYICDAANGVGPMGGGVAAAIRRAGGDVIEQEAIEICRKEDPMPGDLYVTTAGKLPSEKVIHLVTMKQPAGETSYSIVEACLKKLIDYCESNGIEEVALPALGTGVGKLERQKVASLYNEILSPSSVQFLVIDIDEAFIRFIRG